MPLLSHILLLGLINTWYTGTQMANSPSFGINFKKSFSSPYSPFATRASFFLHLRIWNSLVLPLASENAPLRQQDVGWHPCASSAPQSQNATFAAQAREFICGNFSERIHTSCSCTHSIGPPTVVLVTIRTIDNLPIKMQRQRTSPNSALSILNQ